MNVCLIGNIVIRLLNPGFVPGASYLTWEATLTMRCFDYSMFFLGSHLRSGFTDEPTLLISPRTVIASRTGASVSDLSVTHTLYDENTLTVGLLDMSFFSVCETIYGCFVTDGVLQDSALASP